MKEKVLAHIGSLVGGLVHNLNTPLMWIMGRAQLLQSRSEKYDSFRDIPEDQLAVLKEKNDKDLRSIQEGAEKIDSILKALGYKIQMVSEGHTSIELREYLDMELNFLMADMRFKHETKRDVKLSPRSCYVKTDYCALSYAFTGIITEIINATPKGRSLSITLEDGAIRIGCPELTPGPEVRGAVEELCSGLKERADIAFGEGGAFEVSLWLKDL
jgi:two-component system, NtrC family, sensor kinase